MIKKRKMLKRRETAFERMDDSVGMEVEVEIDVVPGSMTGETERLVADSGRMGSPVAPVSQSSTFLIVTGAYSNSSNVSSSSISTQFLKPYLIPFLCYYFLPAKSERKRTTCADVFARLLRIHTTHQQYRKLQ